MGWLHCSTKYGSSTILIHRITVSFVVELEHSMYMYVLGWVAHDIVVCVCVCVCVCEYMCVCVCVCV